MSQIFPSGGIAKKSASIAGAADTVRIATVSVAATRRAVLYKLSVGIDVATEANLKTLNGSVIIKAAFALTTAWLVYVHPYIIHTVTQNTFHSDLGPWEWDFGPDGLYSGVLGENLVVTVNDFGANVASIQNLIYSGDSIAGSSP